jgi:hypothetical protein
VDISPCNEIITEYVVDSRSYYIVWQPPAVIVAGQTEKEAMEDFREAVRFCIGETVEKRIRETG